MRYSTSRELAAYWRALKRGAPLPAARDFDATAAAVALRHSFMLVATERGPRISEASESLVRAWREEPRGASYAALWAPAALPEAMALLAAPMAGSGALAGLRLSCEDGREIGCEALMLPLLRVDKRVSIIVLCALAGLPDESLALGPFASVASSRVLSEAAPSPGFGRRGRNLAWRDAYDDLCRRAASELGAHVATPRIAVRDDAATPAAMVPTKRAGLFLIDGGGSSLS